MAESWYNPQNLVKYVAGTLIGISVGIPIGSKVSQLTNSVELETAKASLEEQRLRTMQSAIEIYGPNMPDACLTYLKEMKIIEEDS
jgi:hypothetical protein